MNPRVSALFSPLTSLPALFLPFPLHSSSAPCWSPQVPHVRGSWHRDTLWEAAQEIGFPAQSTPSMLTKSHHCVWFIALAPGQCSGCSEDPEAWKSLIRTFVFDGSGSQWWLRILCPRMVSEKPSACRDEPIVFVFFLGLRASSQSSQHEGCV